MKGKVKEMAKVKVRGEHIGENAVYVDTCIFLFDLLDREEYKDQCREFLASGKHQLVTSPIAFCEMLHHLMLKEIQEQYDIKNPHRTYCRARQNPDKVKSIKKVWEKLERLKEEYHLTILPIDTATIDTTVELIKGHGLLTNDSFHLAVCKENGIKRIASSDAAFEGIPGLEVWRPEASIF